MNYYIIYNNKRCIALQRRIFDMTNKEIAQKLGISPAALSLIINHKPGVSDATRTKVLSQLKEMGYGNLIKKVSAPAGTNLAFIIYKRHGEILDLHPFFLLLMENIENHARSFGYNIILYTVDKRRELAPQLSYLNTLNCQGAIIFATEMQDEDIALFQKLPYPFVAMDNDFSRLSCNTVAINNQMGSFQAIEHLVKMGHKRIGYLKCNIRINSFVERENGYRAAMEHFGLNLDEKDIITLHYTEESSYRDMREYLESFDRSHASLPTAFVTDDDTITVGVLRALTEQGYQVPEEISLVGFNDRPACQVTVPPLTSVDVSKHAISVETVDELLRMISNREKEIPELRSRKLRIGTKLILRDSVKQISSFNNEC